MFLYLAYISYKKEVITMVKSKNKRLSGNPNKQSGKVKGPGGKPSTTGNKSGKGRDNAPAKK